MDNDKLQAILQQFAEDVRLALAVWTDKATINEAIKMARADCCEAAEAIGGLPDLEEFLSNLESAVRREHRKTERRNTSRRRQSRHAAH